MNEHQIGRVCKENMEVAKSWADNAADFARRTRDWLEYAGREAEKKKEPAMYETALTLAAGNMQSYQQEAKDDLYEFRKKEEQRVGEYYSENPDVDGGVTSLRSWVERKLRTQELLLNYAVDAGLRNPDAPPLRLERLLAEQCDKIRSALR
jgi:hypothetical protein